MIVMLLIVTGMILGTPGAAVVIEAVVYRLVFQRLLDPKALEKYDRLSGTGRALKPWIWETALVGLFLTCQGLYLMEWKSACA